MLELRSLPAQTLSNYSTERNLSETESKRNCRTSTISRYASNYEYQERNNLSFLMWAFEDALIRHNELKLITQECTVESGEDGKDYFCFKQQTAHRTPFLVSDRDNYYSPVLMNTNGKVKGSGLRSNNNAVATTLLPLDFDSEKDFLNAEKVLNKLNENELQFDYVQHTGGRGYQAGYRIDCYPVNTDINRQRYKRVLNALCKLLGADVKATLLTQLLRIPGTPSAKTGRHSSCFVRVGSKRGSYGKLERIENVLIKLGYLLPKKGKKDGVDYRQKRREIIGLIRRNGGVVETSIPELVELLHTPKSSVSYLLDQLERRGRIKRELLRDGQRNKGIRITLLATPEYKEREVNGNNITIDHANNVSNGTTQSKTHSENPDILNIIRKNSTEVLARGGHRHYPVIDSLRLAWINGLLTMQSSDSCRNSALFTVSLADYSAGVCPQQSRRELWAGNLRLKCPLSRIEFERTFNSAYSGRYSAPTLHYLNELKKKLNLNIHGSNAGIRCD